MLTTGLQWFGYNGSLKVQQGLLLLLDMLEMLEKNSNAKPVLKMQQQFSLQPHTQTALKRLEQAT